MNNDLIKIWDKIARKYNYFENTEGYELYPWKILKNLKNSRILEIGSGSGNFSIPLSKQNKVMGIDISNEMLKVCKKFAKQQKAPLNLVRADARYLPFKDNVFDVVFSIGVVEHFSETQQSISEHARVVKPNNLVVVSVPNEASFHYPIKKIAQLIGKYSMGFEQSFTKKELRKMLEKVGLIDVKMQINEIEVGSTTSTFRCMVASAIRILDKVLSLLRIGGGHMILAVGVKQ